MKILVLCLPGIGDSLMATPMIKALRKKFPKATIDVLCMFRSVEYVLKNNPNIDNVFFVPIFTDSRPAAIYHLLPYRKKRYDVSVLAFPSFRKEYHVVQWIINAKKRFAHRFKKGYFTEFTFLNTELISVDENVHNVINNMNLLNLFGFDWQKQFKDNSFTYDLSLDPKDKEYGNLYIDKLNWKKDKVVGLHPGSIDSPAGLLKRWPIERYISLANKLIEGGYKILVFCGPHKEFLGERIMQGILKKKDARLVEGIRFGESLGILSNVAIFISNDNGFAHLANALKIKSIVLFGPTNPLWCAPYNKKYSTIIRRAEFDPWFRNDMKVTSPPKKAQGGMDQIGVKNVLEIFKNEIHR